MAPIMSKVTAEFLHSSQNAPQTGLSDEDYLQLLGLRVRRQRMRRGITRKQLARDSGVSERYLAELEGGRGNISVLLLRAISHALGQPLAELASERPDRGVEEELLAGLLARLDPGQAGQAHNLLMRAFGLADDDRRQTRVALIGLRGAGKSTLGHLLAERCGAVFVELSQTIEKAAGMPVAEVIALGGQSMLRRLEARTLQAAIDSHPRLVIATGGGLVAEPATYDLLLANCFTVWLTARPEEHMARVIAQGDHRPMADNPEAMEDLRRILIEREALYSKADARLDTAGQTVDQSLAALLALLPDPLRPAAARKDAPRARR